MKFRPSLAGYVLRAVLCEVCLSVEFVVHQFTLMHGCNDEQSSENCSASKGNHFAPFSKLNQQTTRCTTSAKVTACLRLKFAESQCEESRKQNFKNLNLETD